MERSTRSSSSPENGPTGIRWSISIVFFLLLGVLLIALGIEARPSDGTGLPVSWIELGMLLVVICCVAVAIGLLRRRKGRGDVTARSGQEAFDERLRRLERLHREGLVDSREYRSKRKDILDEKW